MGTNEEGRQSDGPRLSRFRKLF